jgi:HD superfamily phosphohydrolase YqeK
MEDLRYSILGTMINKKLGLSKKFSKIQAEVYGIIHDIKKNTSEEKLIRMLNETSSNDHV